MYVDQLLQALLVKITISFFLLMIFQEKLGYISWSRNQRSLKYLKHLKLLWRMRVVIRLKQWDQIEEENSLQRNSKSSVQQMEFGISSLFRDPHNKMALQKEKIEPSLIWHEACSKANICRKNFGLKRWIQQSTCPTDLQQKVFDERHSKKLGMEESPKFLTSEYLEV